MELFRSSESGAFISSDEFSSEPDSAEVLMDWLVDCQESSVIELLQAMNDDTGVAPGSQDEEPQDLSRTRDLVYACLKRLPEIDFPKAVQVYGSLCKSQVAASRRAMGKCLPALAVAESGSHGHAWRLWAELLSDEDPEVRDDAFAPIGDALTSCEGQDLAVFLSEIGLTPEETLDHSVGLLFRYLDTLRAAARR
jgi:hypothetical protein